MFMVRVIDVGAAVAWSALGASRIPGDARRVEQLFTSEQCIQCHSLNGKGGTLAPDLSRRVDRDYTPSVMASLMWNHAPDRQTDPALGHRVHLVPRVITRGGSDAVGLDPVLLDCTAAESVQAESRVG